MAESLFCGSVKSSLYFDKTLFIKDFIECKNKVMLMTQVDVHCE